LCLRGYWGIGGIEGIWEFGDLGIEAIAGG
jgi:hypothetical protein